MRYQNEEVETVVEETPKRRYQRPKERNKRRSKTINKGKEMNWREEVALLAFTAVGVLLSILLGLLIFGGF